MLPDREMDEEEEEEEEEEREEERGADTNPTTSRVPTTSLNSLREMGVNTSLAARVRRVV
jgi:hypothetical protein